jgi:hypothetical protein
MKRKPIDPQSSIEFMHRHSGEFAKAKAQRIYLEEFRKSKKAILMQQHVDKPIGAQEREAYAHADYLQVLAALQAAVEQEEALRWKLTAAQTAVEVWRSQEASNRAIDRAAA